MTKLSTGLTCFSLLGLMALQACGGGDTGPAGAAGSQGLTPLVVVKIEAPGANCAAGGSKINTGLDANVNGMLDASEINSTQFVCGGITGATGAPGSATLVRMVAEPAGANCSNAGYKASVGVDANLDSVLQASEVSSFNYLCNGTNGANGTSGASGYRALVAIQAETKFDHCAYGGSRVESGLDTNGNGMLDAPPAVPASEITQTGYICNGSPGSTGATGPVGSVGPAGPGVSWVNVSSTSVQAVGNSGYIANNASAAVVVTLPVNPAFGEVIEVSGAGKGGWKIAQNAGQSIVAQGLPGFIETPSVWKAQASGSHSWSAIASSSDGSRLAAVGFNDNLIYTSPDYGVTWKAQASGNHNWNSIASSSDGSHLAAVDFGVLNNAPGGQIYTSPDHGVTWTAQASGNHQWYAIASSSDGRYLAAADGNAGQIHTSRDYGVTWTAQASGNHNWFAIASSSDGSRLAAVDNNNGQIHTSPDYGVTWTAQASGHRSWGSIASSSDGSRLVAGVFPGLIYTSADYGVTWTAQASGEGNWNSIASSSDGRRLAATNFYWGVIYTSSDYGQTWTAQASGNANWNGIATSSDGNYLAAASSLQVYTTRFNAISPGVNGSVSGLQYDAIALQYIGNGVFIPISYVSTSKAGFVMK